MGKADVKKERIKWIDVAKGISIIAIIIGHRSLNICGFELDKIVYPFSIMIFLLLSGYTMKNETITKEYVNNKFKRLMKPYFITCFIIMAIDILKIFLKKEATIINLTQSLYNNIVSSFFASGTIKSFVYIQMQTRIGAIWFLPALFFTNIIVQSILNHTNNNEKRMVLVSIISILGMVTSKFFWLPFSIQSAMVASSIVLIGYMVKDKKFFEKVNIKHVILCLIVYIIGIYKGYTKTFFVTNSFNDIVINLLVGFAGSILVIKISMLLEKSKILSYLGKNSLIILCVHIVEIERMNFIYDKILGGNENQWIRFALSIVFICIGTFAFRIFQNKIIPMYTKVCEKCLNKFENNDVNKRDLSIDTLRGIAIFLMLLGHMEIDASLRKVIYSCHMVIFIILSGYLYKKKEIGLIKQFIKLIKHFLIPYFIFCIFSILFNYKSLGANEIKKYLFGMSYSKEIFKNIDSIGPVYFVLVLFTVRTIYIVIDKFIKSDTNKVCICLLCTIIGIWLGEKGFWLPWNLDIALYLMIYYEIGLLFKKYDTLNKIKNNYIWYFLLSVLWVYMILEGSMELATRVYENYSIVVIGAISGTLILYMLSAYIFSSKLYITSKILQLSGKYSIFILILHTILYDYIPQVLKLKFSIDYGYYLVLYVIIYTTIGIIIGSIHSIMKQNIGKIKMDYLKKG